jgi:hypothetical protein
MWEYKELYSVDYITTGGLQSALNEAGRLGWEAYASIPLSNGNYKILLKRLIPGTKKT